jgi:glucose/arabinose dehydrogenase
MLHRFVIGVAGVVLCLGCVRAGAQTPPAPAVPLPDVAKADIVVTGLSDPVMLTSIPGNDAYLLVAEKRGRIRVIKVITKPDGSLGYELDPTPALDIKATTISTNNRGLTGLAPAPDFATSGLIYLFHNTTINNVGSTVVARYTLMPGPGVIFDPASRAVIWSAPAGLYHHGGTVKFGPDGMLYISKGDEGDEVFSARNPGSIYGKMLRIDPSRDSYPNDLTRNFAIPAGNPYAGRPGSLPEIWALGMRSQWQFSFDRFNGDFYLGDVGEIGWEEINYVPAAVAGQTKDFGWPNWEGNALPPWGVLQPVPDPATLIFPIYAYPHTPSAGYEQWQVGCSVVGGVVYRGSAIRALSGRYLFADVCNGQVLSLVQTGSATREFQNLTPMLRDIGLPTERAPFNAITCLGEDNQGEVFLVEYLGGRISKIVPQGVQPALADVAGSGQTVGPNGQLTADDIIVYLNWFFAGDGRADLGGPGQSPRPDRLLTADDIILFINAFFAGR